MAKHTITDKAPRPGMTLDQLDAVIRQARAAGALGNEHPTVHVGWRGGIREFTIEVSTNAPDNPSDAPRQRA